MSRLPPDDLTRFRHIRDAAEEALSYAEGRSRSDLETDGQLARALERLIEIIGEAATKIDEETRDSLPQVPWVEIRGMRNWLAHAYFRIHLDYVWDTVNEELPKLLELATEIVETAESDGSQ